MDYFSKALADLVFASEMIKNESSHIKDWKPAHEIESIIDSLDSVIADLEDFLRNKGAD